MPKKKKTEEEKIASNFAKGRYYVGMSQEQADASHEIVELFSKIRQAEKEENKLVVEALRNELHVKQKDATKLGLKINQAGYAYLEGAKTHDWFVNPYDYANDNSYTYSALYDREGNQLTKLVAENSNRIYVTIDKIPEHLQHAFVAIEDERFYEHNGIDIKGIMRAGYTAVSTRDLSQGASTITQQLIKNNVFDKWQNRQESNMEKIRRKIQEQYLAMELEKTMSKEKILELYMNTINLGQNTLGVQAASLRYFNKPVYELNLSECSVIASITQNPSALNPISHPEKNKERRDECLREMWDQGYITEAEYNEALADDVYSRIQTINTEVASSQVYTYFVDEVIEEAIEDLTEYSYESLAEGVFGVNMESGELRRR